MSTDGVDTSRRRFLTAATTVVGAVGAAGVAVPFITSMWPSARAQAAGAPVEADISKLEPGAMLTVEWRGKPVWLVRRTEQNLTDLKSLDSTLRDPNSEVEQQPSYAKNEYRSIKPEVAVLDWYLYPSWVVPRPSGRKLPQLTWVRHGVAVSSVPVTVRASILPGVFIRVCRHRPTWKYRRIHISATPVF